MKQKIVVTLIMSIFVLVNQDIVHAAASHPVTGESLSDNQTFTYRLLDEVPTLDPQYSPGFSFWGTACVMRSTRRIAAGEPVAGS